MLRYKNILFDLDGTLADTQEGISKGVRYAINKMGLELPPEEQFNSVFIGPPLRQVLKNYYHLSDEDTAVAVNLYRDFYSKEGLYFYKIYPGLNEILTELRKEGARLGVSTGKPRVYAEKILEDAGIIKFFDAVVGSELDGRFEKKSEVIAEALKKMNSYSDVVLIGDRNFDCLGAAEFDIPCIGVLYGFGSKEELDEAGAICTVNDVSELRKVLFI